MTTDPAAKLAAAEADLAVEQATTRALLASLYAALRCQGCGTIARPLLVTATGTWCEPWCVGEGK